MCSKKVAGVALLITGLVLVIIGVIIGLLLPNAAQKKIEESVCVNGKGSPGYERWEGPSHYTTRVYYWNITNKDGFLRGEKPQYFVFNLASSSRSVCLQYNIKAN